MIELIKKRIREEIRNYRLTRMSGMVSYSQCGEDMIVRHIFNLRNLKHPTYLDIGAYHPLALSNTALFHKQGSRGITVEANPELHKFFKRYRPEDVNLNVGIGTGNDVLDFYVMEDYTLSTFSKEEKERMCAVGKRFLYQVPIQVVTIQSIIDKYNHGVFPDFMSIDVEGLDFEIIKTIDFKKSYPKVICVEAAEYSPIGAGKRKEELIQFLIDQGYLEYANTNLNAIMVRNEFWNE